MLTLTASLQEFLLFRDPFQSAWPHEPDLYKTTYRSKPLSCVMTLDALERCQVKNFHLFPPSLPLSSSRSLLVSPLPPLLPPTHKCCLLTGGSVVLGAGNMEPKSQSLLLKSRDRAFQAVQWLNTSPSRARAESGSSFPSQEAKIPHVLPPKYQNINNRSCIVTNLNKS